VAIECCILLQLTTWFQATYKDSRCPLWTRLQLAAFWLLSLRKPAPLTSPLVVHLITFEVFLVPDSTQYNLTCFNKPFSVS
ncbi:hypothetical protein AMECASPLE_016990, partial [Ameca splendens]